MRLQWQIRRVKSKMLRSSQPLKLSEFANNALVKQMVARIMQRQAAAGWSGPAASWHIKNLHKHMWAQRAVMCPILKKNEAVLVAETSQAVVDKMRRDQTAYMENVARDFPGAIYSILEYTGNGYSDIHKAGSELTGMKHGSTVLELYRPQPRTRSMKRLKGPRESIEQQMKASKQTMERARSETASVLEKIRRPSFMYPRADAAKFGQEMARVRNEIEQVRRQQRNEMRLAKEQLQRLDVQSGDLNSSRQTNLTPQQAQKVNSVIDRVIDAGLLGEKTFYTAAAACNV